MFVNIQTKLEHVLLSIKMQKVFKMRVNVKTPPTCPGLPYLDEAQLIISYQYHLIQKYEKNDSVSDLNILYCTPFSIFTHISYDNLGTIPGINFPRAALNPSCSAKKHCNTSYRLGNILGMNIGYLRSPLLLLFCYKTS